MSVRSLHLLGSPVLRERAKPVPAVDDTVRQFVADLFDTMHAAKGVGLAANQVGVALRVAVVDVGEETPDPLVLINPIVTPRGDVVETAEEGCLSIPDLFAEVERPLEITLEALDRDGKPYRMEISGYKARAVQHEVDHLDGVLFLDHLTAVKRASLLSKWRRARKGQTGYVKEVVPEPAGEL
ncbi:MAG TPA: peptide deformylase [Gemmatimonadales bacterium]|nr:peptide deformylase [Gemmatimonadales bacterium]